jgi:uncharacterized OsmC-like protein
MQDAAIVRKVDGQVAPSCFGVTPFRRAKPEEPVRFEVNLVAEAGGKMRKQARVEPNLEGWSAFDIACDEGLALGGEDTAPPPLAYLSAGVAFCLLTHLQEFSRQWSLSIDSLRVEQRMQFSKERGAAHQDARARGHCDGVETHVIVESGEDADRIRKLIDRAWHACMAMQAIVNATPQKTHLHLNGACGD